MIYMVKPKHRANLRLASLLCQMCTSLNHKININNSMVLLVKFLNKKKKIIRVTTVKK